MAETRISQEKSISIALEEFKKEYMAVRDFVFYNMLTSDETNSLRTVVSFYDKVSAPIIKRIYHAYAQDFFTIYLSTSFLKFTSNAESCEDNCCIHVVVIFAD